MRYLLTIAFLLMATSCFAVLTKTYTIKESGGDYTTLQAAESAHNQDLVANDSALTFEISGTWVSADGGLDVNGWTTDATRFLTIIAIGDSKASATFSTTAYLAELDGSVLHIQESYTVVDGLQARTITTAGLGTINCSTDAAGNFVIRNCFVSGNGIANARGILFNQSSASGIVAYNNVVIDCLFEGIRAITAAGGAKIDNNTIENCTQAIESDPGADAIARNNILWNCTTPLVGDFNTTTLSEENYTDDASLSYGSCGSCGTGDQLSQSDPFVNLAGENYHLASGATAIDAGKDLSADFTDDIDGDTRDANFDKGADEFIPPPPPKVMIRK